MLSLLDSEIIIIALRPMEYSTTVWKEKFKFLNCLIRNMKRTEWSPVQSVIDIQLTISSLIGRKRAVRF